MLQHNFVRWLSKNDSTRNGMAVVVYMEVHIQSCIITQETKRDAILGPRFVEQT